jgi:hypothetical protein
MKSKMKINQKVEIMYKSHNKEPLSRKQKKKQKKAFRLWFEDMENSDYFKNLDSLYIYTNSDIATINWVNP